MIVRRFNPPTRCAPTATGAPAGLSPSSPGGGIYSDDGIREHRPVASEASHEVLNYLADQPRVALIGADIPGQPDIGDFSVPMLFFSFHRLEVPDAR